MEQLCSRMFSDQFAGKDVQGRERASGGEQNRRESKPGSVPCISCSHPRVTHVHMARGLCCTQPCSIQPCSVDPAVPVGSSSPHIPSSSPGKTVGRLQKMWGFTGSVRNELCWQQDELAAPKVSVLSWLLLAILYRSSGNHSLRHFPLSPE